MLSLKALRSFLPIQKCIYQKARNYAYTPRRAVMYVPGDDKRKLRKVTQLDVDCIALDCEDGVALNRKSEARQTIRAFFDSGMARPLDDCLDKRQKSEWAVRLNSVDSGLCDEDLAVIMSGEHPPGTLLLPKCDSSDGLRCFSEKLTKHLSRKQRINLIIYAESCRSIMDLPEICRTAVQLSTETSCCFETVGVLFGSDDFCATIGATRTEDSQEIIYARQRVVLVAKAFGFQAIDMVYIQYKNLEGLKAQSDAGARMGYTGKQIIHPGQIDIVQKAFLPSADKVEWATGLLAAFHEHQKSGKGAFVYHNQMIDMPTMKQAQNILDVMKTVQ